MTESAQQMRQEMLSTALDHLRTGLHLLDRADAPGQLGARLDLTIHELYLVIAKLSAGPGFTHIARNAAPQ